MHVTVVIFMQIMQLYTSQRTDCQKVQPSSLCEGNLFTISVVFTTRAPASSAMAEKPCDLPLVLFLSHWLGRQRVQEVTRGPKRPATEKPDSFFLIFLNHILKSQYSHFWPNFWHKHSEVLSVNLEQYELLNSYSLHIV